MDITAFYPREYHTVLKELAAYDWAKITPLERYPFGGQLRRKTPSDASPRVGQLMADLNAFSQSNPRAVSDLVLVLRAVGLALAEGPKVYCPAAETCEALRHVALDVHWPDFKLPFRHLIVKFPHDWATSHARTLGVPKVPAACLLAFLQPDYFAAIIQQGQEMQQITLNDWHHHSTVTIEEQLTRLIAYRDASPEVGTVRQGPEFANTFFRVALNAGMLLTSVGTTSLGWLDPKAQQKAERLTRKLDPKQRERGRTLLAGQLMQVGLARDITVYFRSEDRPESVPQGGLHNSPRTHWRRGHFRRQPYGPRENPSYRVVFIAPMFIGGRGVGQAPEPIGQTYVDAKGGIRGVGHERIAQQEQERRADGDVSQEGPRAARPQARDR